MNANFRNSRKGFSRSALGFLTFCTWAFFQTAMLEQRYQQRYQVICFLVLPLNCFPVARSNLITPAIKREEMSSDRISPYRSSSKTYAGNMRFIFKIAKKARGAKVRVKEMISFNGACLGEMSYLSLMELTIKKGKLWNQTKKLYLFHVLIFISCEMMSAYNHHGIFCGPHHGSIYIHHRVCSQAIPVVIAACSSSRKASKMHAERTEKPLSQEL
ncbi:hypothetical protein KSP39_PZI013994 [Platanthera zijinensis]|uniref:Uncharacterized protein n=1 Tax=Platanthera zijinensis TaxID=2320716 RepID=A0AAP0G3P8_9ASPA